MIFYYYTFFNLFQFHCKRGDEGLSLAILISITSTILEVNVQAAQTITSNQTGTSDGYNYELWKDSGTTSMNLNGGGEFSCSWSSINTGAAKGWSH
jgi:hypothetical protein